MALCRTDLQRSGKSAVDNDCNWVNMRDLIMKAKPGTLNLVVEFHLAKMDKFRVAQVRGVFRLAISR